MNNEGLSAASEAGIKAAGVCSRKHLLATTRLLAFSPSQRWLPFHTRLVLFRSLSHRPGPDENLSEITWIR